jgi:hypothetical protein
MKQLLLGERDHGTRYPELYVQCMNKRCLRSRKETPIRLLVPVPLQTEPDPSLWPDDGRWLYLACPECILVFAYNRPGIAEFPPKGDEAWMCISFRCKAATCNAPAEFHVLIDTGKGTAAESQAREQLATGYWTGALPCGHPIIVAKEQNVIFEWDRGSIHGYDPNHWKWQRI